MASVLSEKHAIAPNEPMQYDEFGQDADKIEELNGEFVLTVDAAGDGFPKALGLRLAKDGRTILVPQPTGDPQDPLNWSSYKKHALLFLVALGSFCGDFGAAAGIPAVIVQAEQWAISPNTANFPNNLAAIMSGISGIIWMPLINSWGRAPVLFWASFLGLWFTLGTCLTNDFKTFYAMRCLQTVMQSTGQTIGLAFIEDCFFFHEHARKIGIWYVAFISGPFMSPMLGNFVIGKTGNWRIVFWLVFGLVAMLICSMLAFADETFYDRHVPMDKQPARPAGHYHRLLRVTGIWQIRHHSRYFSPILASYLRLFDVLRKPIMPMIMLFYSAVFAWFVGINISSAILLQTPQSMGGYGLSSVGVGYVYFTPIVAAGIGEVFGHWFNDFLVKVYAKRHDGHFVAETRLWTTYIGVLLQVFGLILTGQALANHLNVAAIVFGWGLEGVGVMIVSVAIVAYGLDCYPSAPGEVSALINMARVGSGFSVGFYQQQWGKEQGYGVSFGLQAVIVVVFTSFVVLCQLYGKRLRKWAGPARSLKP